MVKKLQKSGDEEGSTASAQLAGTVKESAQQIWLAGLGAFSKAQEEGGKVFEALVREGVTLQRRTQSAAEGKLAEASSRMTSMANDLSTKASGQWDKLETIFEDRVSRALQKLGVPTAREIDELSAQVAKLSKAAPARAAKTSAASKTNGVAKPAAKRAAARKSA